MNQLVIRQLLTSEYRRIQSRNRAYTRGSFARKLGISSSALSEILSDKRRVSRKLAERILDRMDVPERQKATVLELFANGSADRGGPKTLHLKGDEYQLIAEWYHFAILSLLEVEGARHNARWIGEQLKLPMRTTEEALNRMIRVGVLEKQADGTFAITHARVTTPDQVQCAALQKSHRNNLLMAGRSLEHDDVAGRDFTAITMAIDPDRLPAARAAIRKFRDELATLLESGRKRNVYKFCMQLFPLPQEERS